MFLWIYRIHGTIHLAWFWCVFSSTWKVLVCSGFESESAGRSITLPSTGTPGAGRYTIIPEQSSAVWHRRGYLDDFVFQLTLFWGLCPQHAEVPGQGSHLSHSSDNAKSLTAKPSGNSCIYFQIYNIIYAFIMFIICFSLLKSKFYKDRTLCLFCSLLYAKCLEHWLAHSNYWRIKKKADLSLLVFPYSWWI